MPQSPENKMLAALKDWTRWLGGWILLIAVCAFLLGQTPAGRDDTDAGQWGDTRSGVKPVTDALTGCQYLMTPDGGITPRLNKAGEQVGCHR